MFTQESKERDAIEIPRGEALDAESAFVLMWLLADECPEIKKHACRGLRALSADRDVARDIARTAEPYVLDCLVACLRAGDADTRAYAAGALAGFAAEDVYFCAEFGRRRGVCAALRRMGGGVDAARCLHVLSVSHGRQIVRARCLPVLAEMLNDESTRLYAIAAIQNICRTH